MNNTVILVGRKLLKAFCPGHFLQSAHPVRPMSKRGILCECVDEDLERLLLRSGLPDILLSFVWLIRVGVQQKEKSIVSSVFCWFLHQLCNVKCVAKLAFKDGWLELVTDCQIIKLWSFLSKQAAVPLVGAEGDKSRRRKIAFLVRSQVDWVEGQFS